MDFNEHTYDEIQRYLDKELSGEELQAFEARLREDEALATEVKLHEEMSGFLGDSEENALRKNLQKLNNEVTEIPQQKDVWRRKFGYFLWIFTLLVVGGLGMYYWGNQTTDDLTESVPSMEVEKIVPSNLDEIESIEKTDETEGKTEETDIKQPEVEKNKPKDTLIYAQEDKQQNNINQPNDKKPPVLAANFDPNPALELLMENNLRSSDFEVKVENFTKNVKITSKNKAVDFRFAGTITSSDSLLDNNFELHVFSNDKVAYQNFKTLLSEDFKIEKSEEEIYTFDFQKKLVLPTGLYYVLLENRETERVLFVEQFFVKE